MNIPRLSHGLLCLALLLCSAPASSSNGFNVIGFSGESEMMGGADVAIARDVTALGTNPAGLTQIRNRELNLFASPYYTLDISHSDSVGNDSDSKPSAGILGGAGYAQRINANAVAGVGLFVQGGSGFTHKNFDSGFGAQGDLSAIFGVFKIAPGLAWQLNDQLSIGGAVNLLYATARQKVFPDASIEAPGLSFQGNRLDGLRAFGLGAKLGAMYKPNTEWTIGLSFGSRSPLKLKNGEMKFNYEAAGLGRVTYQDARIDGLALAQDVSLGVAYQASSRWMVSAELSWLDWSNAVKTIRIMADNPVNNPDTAVVPDRQEQATALNYRDQYIIALGASYVWNDRTRIRAGFNYGRHPTPEQNLNPLFAVIGQQHFCLGIARDLNSKWELSAGLQLQGPRSERYQNPALPFTADAKENNSALWLSTSLIRRW